MEPGPGESIMPAPLNLHGHAFGAGKHLQAATGGKNPLPAPDHLLIQLVIRTVGIMVEQAQPLHPRLHREVAGVPISGMAPARVI